MGITWRQWVADGRIKDPSLKPALRPNGKTGKMGKANRTRLEWKTNIFLSVCISRFSVFLGVCFWMWVSVSIYYYCTSWLFNMLLWCLRMFSCLKEILSIPNFSVQISVYNMSFNKIHFHFVPECIFQIFISAFCRFRWNDLKKYCIIHFSINFKVRLTKNICCKIDFNFCSLLSLSYFTKIHCIDP